VPSEKDPYEVLGVPRDATLEQIRRKWRKLVKKFHPDVVAPDGDPEMLEYANRMTAQINAAWEILSSPDDRAAYDSEHRPPHLVVYDVVSEIEVDEGEPAIVQFKVDNRGGPMPPGARLRFSPVGGWIELKPARIESLRDDSPFPIEVELLIDTDSLPADVWHEGEIELGIEEG
jgi:curved DNA-binding protein CbpA